MTAPKPAGDFEIAQARKAIYGLIANGFQYPDRNLVNTLADPARWSSWPQVLRSIHLEVAGQLDHVRASLQVEAGKLGDDPGAEPTELQETCNRLFGHAVRGKCPPYELEYGQSEIIQQASFLADITGFYAAFGMEISSRADERPDHIAVECEFMSVLCAKEAHAIEEPNPDHVDISVKAQRDFLKAHLARWGSAFAHRVLLCCPQGFYGALAKLAITLIAAECRRLKLTVGPQTLELRPIDPVLDTTITCAPPDDAVNPGEDRSVQLDVHGQPREEQ